MQTAKNHIFIYADDILKQEFCKLCCHTSHGRLAQRNALYITGAVKYRSMLPGHSVFLKSMSKTITTKGLTLLAVTAAEKHT